MSRTAANDYPIHNTLAVRWSPYVFSARPVRPADLRSIFEAARWAPSSYNEQPWRFIVGIKGPDKTHERIVDCLVEGNQAWARLAPVLVLGVVMTQFAGNDKPNKAATHDLGLASANMLLEATRRKLHAHMMIGLDPAAAHSAFELPDNAEAVTAMAIGYRETDIAGDVALRERETKPRTRRPQDEFVFGGHFGRAADFDLR